MQQVREQNPVLAVAQRPGNHIRMDRPADWGMAVDRETAADPGMAAGRETAAGRGIHNLVASPIGGRKDDTEMM